jgi:response regulator RpfG family c-di-GMP phosphodiesterase
MDNSLHTARLEDPTAENVEQSDILLLRPMLRFADLVREKSFVRHYHAFYYRYAQASLAVGLMLIFADFVVDYFAFPDQSANLYRIELCMPIICVGIAWSFTRYARQHWQTVMAAFIAVVAFSLFWVLLVMDRQGGMGLKSWVGILNFVFLEFYCFVILGVQFSYAFVSGVSILLAFEAAMLLDFAVDWSVFSYWSYHVVTLFVLSAGIGWWREFVLRKDFSTQAALKTARDFLREQNASLEAEVRKRTREIVESQDAAILTLASLVETRDKETGNHVRRTQHYVRALARQLQPHPDFRGYLTDHQIDILFKSAPLHDIGKVGIPDSILLKPGKLDPEEFEVMKSHTTLGHKAIEDAQEQLGTKVEFLACVQEIAWNHHEKWDGSGYPRKLVGSAIPISARLMAVADVYDALISKRVYKKSMSHEQATAVIMEGAGQHFDPDVADAFAAIADEFKVIAERYAS